MAFLVRIALLSDRLPIRRLATLVRNATIIPENVLHKILYAANGQFLIVVLKFLCENSVLYVGLLLPLRLRCFEDESLSLRYVYLRKRNRRCVGRTRSACFGVP